MLNFLKNVFRRAPQEHAVGELLSDPWGLARQQLVVALAAIADGHLDAGRAFMRGGVPEGEVTNAFGEFLQSGRYQLLAQRYQHQLTALIELCAAARKVAHVPKMHWVEHADPVAYEVLCNVGRPAIPPHIARIFFRHNMASDNPKPVGSEHGKTSPDLVK